MQHIIIKNNGPVKEFEMDVNKYNVLIGEQHKIGAFCRKWQKHTVSRLKFCDKMMVSDV